MDKAAASAPTKGNAASGDDDSISDVDYRLIGLSPQYWSYTRLSVGDLNSLPLINGVDCFITPRHRDDSESDNNSHQWHIFPLSRVLLRGIVTAIDRRPNGCTLIVIDDGTGAVDCRCWEESSNSAFHLPALLPQHRTSMNRNGLRYDIGDSVEIMGKIKTLTAGDASSAAGSTLSENNTTPLEVRFGCIREVHATSVCVIDTSQSSVTANVWNGEAVHWLKCINVEKEVRKENSTMKNGKDVLSLLGDKVSSSILHDGDSTTIGKKNVLVRQCCQTPQRFRQALFYCHCEATLEALDSTFSFRDAVLNHLLDCESQLQHIESCVHQAATEDCMDLYGAEANSMPPPFLFTFQSICSDARLSSIARSLVSATNLPNANFQRLLQKTFAAMTKDGLLSLYDPAEDLYLLVSCGRVLEPFLKRSKGMDDGGFFRPNIPEPFFIRSVPRKRLNELASHLTTQQSDSV
mmetsp:Transcript_1987/g.4355  ORF Transcript_1987/g.4355 Transcript_1987/m.4355 type:complete len:464 (+) Transcript_1987:41-1432(+)